jgi:hypothetical protein
MASRVARGVLGAVLGAVAGGLATVFGGIAAGEVFRISQAEGAYMMQVAFVFTPLGILAGGILGAALLFRGG